MLRTREPITLRSLVAGTCVSTMAVYTHFNGMDGMWRALRQEGFTRLAARLATVVPSDDPIRDLAALGAAYVGNAFDSPDLYRVMFDATFELEDAHAADQTLHTVILAADRARQAHRFDADTDSLELATKTWAIWHGLVSLVATGPLPRQTLDYGVSMLTALFVSAGDEQARCRASVKRGWVHDRTQGG
ncbi:TetR-like C-terminal domain-containing protein [Micromonospora sp. NPDC049799]|uniref:TetR/AcrR family transcriptional regulator n=1 Tax=Micromonospora sp. NPDC049799 TaxID=3154741 RepID=UPI0033F32A4D